MEFKVNLKTLICGVMLASSVCMAQIASAANDIPRKIHFSTLDKLADNTLEITVSVEEGLGDNNMSWVMSSSQRAVFFAKFKALQKAKEAYSPLNIPDPESAYTGLSVTIKDTHGRNLIPIYIYKASVRDERGNLITLDPSRQFEYWLWSTGAPENLGLAGKILPIIDFNHCVDLGHRLVETTPRQCLLANGDIFLDILESPTQESLAIHSFDDCLAKGQALINTFPRRCIASGGHVFSEPARLRSSIQTTPDAATQAMDAYQKEYQQY